MAGFAYQPPNNTTGKSGGVGGRLVASVFFLLFLAMGSFFVVTLVTEFGRTVRQWAWKSAPCKVLVSEVQDRTNSDRPYAFTVNYTYEYDGRTYSGSVYERRYKASATYSEAQKLSQKYPVGLATSCYVDPKGPANAVLKQDSLALGFFILIPLVFVVIGAGGLYFTWRPKPELPTPEAAPLSGQSVRSGGKGTYVVAAFFGVFAVVGLATLFPFGIKPIAETIDAQSWVATPCRVLHAEVRSHSDSDDGGTTYSVYVLYQYTVDGKPYKSDTYDFVGGSSSGYDRKAKIVQQYRSAANPVCYVNPRDPNQAVLRRGFHAGLLVILLPLVFMLVGFGGAYFVVYGKPRPAVDGASVLRLADTGPVVLKPRHSPLAKLAGAIFIALFWDGIVSVFVAQMIGSFRSGHPNWSLVLFLIPFEVIGIVILAFVVYQFLALFNPRVTLELSSGAIPLGRAAALRWTMWGWVSRIKEFTVTLRGVEEVTYQTSGKDAGTATAKNTFYEMELCRTSKTDEIAAGSVGVVIPRETMYSFEAKNNKIIWNLDIHGQIARWPDVKESFKFAVVPARG